MSFRSSNDRLKLSSLFLEPKYQEDALYTLSDKDKEYKGKTYPSLYKLYVNMADVTEYNFANTYFESYQHWDELCSQDWFKPYVNRWRKELELKIKSQALVEIIKQASSEDPRKALEASKYLYEKVYAGDKNSRGRPSKAEVRKAAQQQALEQRIVDEHWSVLGGEKLN